MRVYLKTVVAGPNGNYSPGVHELPEGWAQQLIAAGFATEAPRLGAEMELETATAEPPEAAIQPKPKRRRRGS